MSRIDWMARRAWTNPTDNPDVAKAKKNGVWYINLDGHDRLTPTAIQRVAAAGLIPCLYFAQNWWPDLSPEQYAQQAALTTNWLLPKAAYPDSEVQLDLEVHDRGWLEVCMAEWRRHEPHRFTSYTGEPYQGDFVPYRIMKMLGIHYFVQTYYGDESPAEAAPLDAARWGHNVCGFDPSMIHPFYLGKDYDSNSHRDGAYFFLEDMP